MFVTILTLFCIMAGVSSIITFVLTVFSDYINTRENERIMREINAILKEIDTAEGKKNV